MFLKELNVYQFKNISEATLSFSTPVTFFCGNNGVGKTNLLDAIYYLSFTKSFLNTTDTENINYSKDLFRIHGKYNISSNIEEFSCVVTKEGRKSFRYFQKEYQRLYEHIGKIPLVLISPSDYLYLTEGSESRRKLLDSMISQICPDYLAALVEYNKILKQRNSLLKTEQDNKQKCELIEIFDIQLEKPATIIYQHRKSFCEQLRPIFQELYLQLSHQSDEQVNLTYKSQLHDNTIVVLLKQHIEKDLLTSYTNCGIHKDDLIFTLNNNSIRYFASQGQQKTYLTSLKLAFAKLISQKHKSPIILLDDIFDKLDDSRVKNLLTLIQQSSSQAFITHTDSNKIQEWLKNCTIFELSYGQITQKF